VHRFRRLVPGVFCVAALVWAAPAFAQDRPIALAISRADIPSMRAADQQVDQVLRSGDLTRQVAPDGTVSIFGMLHSVAIDTNPGLTLEQARVAIPAAVGGQPLDTTPELVVLPLSDGYHLAYRGRAFVGLAPSIVMIDASTGALLHGPRQRRHREPDMSIRHGDVCRRRHAAGVEGTCRRQCRRQRKLSAEAARQPDVRRAVFAGAPAVERQRVDRRRRPARHSRSSVRLLAGECTWYPDDPSCSRPARLPARRG